jgi:hypothetical protein
LHKTINTTASWLPSSPPHPPPPASPPTTADGWRHDRIQLLPLNPAFKPITLEPEDTDALTIVGEFVRVSG